MQVSSGGPGYSYNIKMYVCSTGSAVMLRGYKTMFVIVGNSVECSDMTLHHFILSRVDWTGP